MGNLPADVQDAMGVAEFLRSEQARAGGELLDAYRSGDAGNVQRTAAGPVFTDLDNQARPRLLLRTAACCFAAISDVSRLLLKVCRTTAALSVAMKCPGVRSVTPSAGGAPGSEAANWRPGCNGSQVGWRPCTSCCRPCCRPRRGRSDMSPLQQC